MTQLLTVNEVATELRLSKSTVLRLLAGGIPNRPTLRAVRVGRRVMIRRETLDRFVQEAEEYTQPHEKTPSIRQHTEGRIRKAARLGWTLLRRQRQAEVRRVG